MVLNSSYLPDTINWHDVTYIDPKITTAQVVETSVIVSNSPIQD